MQANLLSQLDLRALYMYIHTLYAMRESIILVYARCYNCIIVYKYKASWLFLPFANVCARLRNLQQH